MEQLLPYFHAHDQYNYGRWGPLYVADMLDMQTSDPSTWAFLDDGNFVITKNNVPFTAIATLSRIVQEFKEYAGIESRAASSLHHEIGSHKSSRMIMNAAKLARAISIQGNPHLKEDMHNLVTFAVTPASVSSDIENRDKLGREALERFIENRMVSNTVEFWASQKKNNLSFFKDVGAVVQTKIKGQLQHVRQERKLLSRLLVVAKSRPDFIVKDAIGKFEMNVTPPSNFHPDGSLIMLSSKSQVMPLVMGMPDQECTSVEVVSDVETASNEAVEQVKIKVLIVDAMCVVNMVTKTPEMFTAKHFATKFLHIITSMSAAYDEIRIVFDQYLEKSLKETTREKRAMKITPVHYHVNDDTEVKSVKAFLSHTRTKHELTSYLAQKLLSHYHNHMQKVIVTYHDKMEANCPLSDIISIPEMIAGQHSIEEGDQLVLLNAVDVMHKDPETMLDVFSLDTDVFVLLTGHFQLIPPSTTVVRKLGERISIKESYTKLGPKRSSALIGWYIFKGSDNTGSFAGKGVACHFRALLQADDGILDGFSKFGTTPEIPHWIYEQMERYICLLYKIGSITTDNVAELRWILFAQKNKEGQQLPPTTGTLIPHTSRAYYMALVWKMSTVPKPEIPPATNYYWKSVEGKLRPVYCTNLPAPEALLILQKCNCQTGCNRKSCGCNKNNLKCTDMCGCGDLCQNVFHDHPVDIDLND